MDVWVAQDAGKTTQHRRKFNLNTSQTGGSPKQQLGRSAQAGRQWPQSEKVLARERLDLLFLPVYQVEFYLSSTRLNNDQCDRRVFDTSAASHLSVFTILLAALLLFSHSILKDLCHRGAEYIAVVYIYFVKCISWYFWADVFRNVAVINLLFIVVLGFQYCSVAAHPSSVLQGAVWAFAKD